MFEKGQLLTNPGSRGTLVLGKLGPLGKPPGGQKIELFFRKNTISNFITSTKYYLFGLPVNHGECWRRRRLLHSHFLASKHQLQRYDGLGCHANLELDSISSLSCYFLKFLAQFKIDSSSFTLSFTSTQLRRLEKSSWRRPYEK